MEKTIKILSKGFASSSTTTPQFASYARTFKNEVKKEIESIGGTLVSFNRGHFYVSGFFSVKDQMFYFSQSDVRWFAGDNLLVRTAKHDKDFTGGANNFVQLGAGMFNRLPTA